MLCGKPAMPVPYAGRAGSFSQKSFYLDEALLTNQLLIVSQYLKRSATLNIIIRMMNTNAALWPICNSHSLSFQRLLQIFLEGRCRCPFIYESAMLIN